MLEDEESLRASDLRVPHGGTGTTFYKPVAEIAAIERGRAIQGANRSDRQRRGTAGHEWTLSCGRGCERCIPKRKSYSFLDMQRFPWLKNSLQKELILLQKPVSRSALMKTWMKFSISTPSHEARPILIRAHDLLNTLLITGGRHRMRKPSSFDLRYSQ